MKESTLAKSKQAAKQAIAAAKVKGKTRKEAGDAVVEDRSPVPEPPPADTVVAYFEASKGGFYTGNSKGEFQRTDKETLNLELRSHGFHRKAKSDYHLSPVEAELLRITKTNQVDYAGEVGGFPPGVHRMMNSRVLVTRGPNFIKPVEGAWSLFGGFLDELLKDEKRYFLAWMKWSLISLRRGLPFNPGQALALAGPVSCGKSFLQSLITPLLGGRASKPYRYLVGKSEFNGDIFAAEHAIIGDEVPLLDIRSRRNFGSALKNLIVTKEQSIHRKTKDAVTLTPFIRVTISLNDDPESIMALPPLDTDVKDKLLILKASQVAFPWPCAEFPNSQSYYNALIGELPAFLHWLLKWKVPEAIKDQRYGVVSYHNPDLVKSVDDLAPEWKLWELMNTYFGSAKLSKEIVMSSQEIERELRKRDDSGEVARLLNWGSACGQFLGKLLHKMPELIKDEYRGQGRRVFTITLPAKTPEKNGVKEKDGF